MRLDLTKLREGRLEERFEIGPDHPVLEGYDFEIREPIGVDVELVHPAQRTFVMTARIRGTALEPCRRCLVPTAVEIDETFRTVFQEPGRDAEESDEPGDDDIVWIDRGAAGIEIDRQVRDRLFLETERYPVCREECKGICPVCGTNRNEKECSCTVETVDSRWGELEKLDLGEKG
ncbi:MAG: DUF177 domain-containing protein [Gemmatimonadetes bacterium]|nr:DUF177 domain-containing protein [Gemmatimonadota bacterium]